MRNSYSLLILLVFSIALPAQNKQLTIEDALLKSRTTLAPDRLKQLAWVKNSNDFTYVINKNGTELLIKGTANTTTQSPIIFLTALNNLLRKADNDTLKGFPVITWQDRNTFLFESAKKLYAYAIDNANLMLLSTRDFGKEAENADIAPDNRMAAFTVKNNLCVFDGTKKIAVTADENEDIVNGKSVHREEFGIYKGTFWSPKSNLLAFYRMDQTMVTDYPIIDWNVKPAKATFIKYPMAGDKSHQVAVGIYNVKTQTTHFLKTGEPAEQYLTNITWSPDEQHVYIAVLNRDQNHLKLNSYNATTGDYEQTLFEEKDEKYVHPLNPFYFVTTHPDLFVWQSQRDGYNHLYLYTTKGKLLKQLTKGNWVVTEFKGFDASGEKAFFTATAEGPTTRNAYSVDLHSGKLTRITNGEGTHSPSINDNGNYLIDNFSSLTVPREIAIYTIATQKKQVLLTAANPLTEYKLGKLNLFTLKSENGDELFCRLYKPVNFDSTKKYPAIVYLYGGPNTQLVNNSWNGGAGDLWFQYMAERGFVIFTLDNHGSANRGKNFEQATFRNLGANEMKDQLSGVNFLKSQPYIDATRLGLFGWSYGGFMTTSIMTRYADVFKVAVAGGPVIDWSYYEVMYTERYMDTPQTNPKGYEETNVFNHIDNLKGKLLVIHGTADPVVVWQQSILFVKAAVDKKKQIDYFVYPGHEHNVLGKDRVHLYQKVTDYFLQNL